MENLPKKKKGMWMTDFLFDIDNNWILRVSSVEMESERENKLTVKGVAKGMTEVVDQRRMDVG